MNKILISLILITILDLYYCGIPLLSENIEIARLEPRIPFISSLIVCLYSFYSTNLLIEYFKKRINLKFLLIINIIFITYSIILVARGNIVHLTVMYLIAYLVYSKNRNKIIYMSIILILVTIVSSFAGNLRQGSDFLIKNYGEFNYNLPDFIYWLYGYLFINIDNLILNLRAFDNNEFEGKTFQNYSKLITQIIIGEKNDIEDLPYVGRFNLTTAFGPIIYDFGMVGVIIFLTIIFIIFCKIKNICKFSNISESNTFYVVFLYSIMMMPISNIIITSKFFIYIIIYLTTIFFKDKNVKSY